MRNFLFIAIIFFTGITTHAQEADKEIQKGNNLYKQEVYDRAEFTYKQVLSKDKTNTTAKFNEANALYKQSKQVDAVKSLEELLMNTTDADLKSKAYYNKGVIFSSQKRLEESIEMYKNALRQNPDDKDARENLQKALLELKKKTPPPPKKDNKPKQNQQKKQQQSQMDRKEAEQRLKLLEQKEKELQQRMQKQKSQSGSGQPKDW